MDQIWNFVGMNAKLLVLIMLLIIVVLAAMFVLWIVLYVKRGNKWREKEYEQNRDTEMLHIRIGELEKETAELHEHESQMLAERDSILMEAHEKADDILEQTMERVQKSEAQIRQNRIIASCCITDARRRISDMLIEISKRLVIEDGNVLGAEEITPEALEAAEREEKASEATFERLTAGVEGIDEVEPVETDETVSTEETVADNAVFAEEDAAEEPIAPPYPEVNN